MLLAMIPMATLNATDLSIDLPKESVTSYHIETIKAKYAASEQTIDEFTASYIANNDPKKDEILIPAIRHSGRLDAFYVSLAENGNIDVLARLMNMDYLLTRDIRNAIFLKQTQEHIFSAAEQAAFDQESARWVNLSVA